MSIDARLLDEQGCVGSGYRSVFAYGAWRVATLCHSNECSAENITSMQRHEETDELFVLLAGRCILFVGEGDESVTAIHARDMESLRVYNMKRRVWHTHVLNEDAVVLIVENRDTTTLNSPECPLSETQRAEIRRTVEGIWGRSMISATR